MQKFIALSKEYLGLHAVLCDLPSNYREIFGLYEKATLKNQQGFYPIHRIAACLKIANMLARMVSCGFVGYITDGASFELDESKSDKGKENNSAAFIGVRPMDASSWAMKAWDCGVEYLTLSDQAASVATMASIYSRLGFKVYFLSLMH